MEVNNEMLLTEMEKDVIGEVMNISLGSSATSLSSLLSKRVDITVPRVKVTNTQDFDFNDMDPAIGVEIKYIDGVNGDNVLILKKADIKVILETLMSIEIPDDEFVLDEIAMSAVSEVMNQMMGSAATALADFLGKPVNISTPVAYEITDKESFKGRYFSEDSIVEVKFDLKVGDVINSEFLNVFSIPLAKEMVGLFLKGTGIEQNDSGEMVINQSFAESTEKNVTQNTEKAQEPRMQAQEKIQEYEPELEEIPAPKPKLEEKVLQPEPRLEERVQKPSPRVEPEVSKYIDKEPREKVDSYEDDFKEEDERLHSRRPKRRKMPEYYDDYDDEEYDYYQERPRKAAPERKARRSTAPVNVAPIQYESFDDDEEVLSEEQKTNLGLIMSVPLQVTVEIGRTKKKIKDILEFSQGTIVELDKQAGTQVDIIINGQVIAKGDVVVVNDNFGVRVSEIIKKDEIFKLTV